MKRPSEHSIESRAVKDLRAGGARVAKLNMMGQRSWPDRLVIALNGAHTYIEFKKPGEDLTPLQAELHQDLARRGITVHVARSVEEALSAYVEETVIWQEFIEWRRRRQVRRSSPARTKKKA